MSVERLPEQYVVRAITGLPDFRPGDDLAGAICAGAPWLADGDIIAVTSKAVSKAEGRLVPTGTSEAERQVVRQRAIDGETAAVVAQRGGVRIVRTKLGPTMAAAGVDASNVNGDEIALLPLDCDASARQIRSSIRRLLGVQVAVIITDTVGRPWRNGLVDIALGSAGIAPLRDLRGTVDTHGHPLAVTALAQIDELASASELVRGKLGRVAAAVIRGIPYESGDPATSVADCDASTARDCPDDHDSVRPADAASNTSTASSGTQQAPLGAPADGAGSLVRSGDDDMFALGTRDVVPAALSARSDGRDADAGLVQSALDRVAVPVGVTVDVDGCLVTASGPDDFALGLFVGHVQVALRAEGLAAAIERRGTDVTVRASVAAPYEGMPR